VLAIMVVSLLGVGLVNVVIAVAIAGVPRFARVVRGAVMVAKEQLFIEAARALAPRTRHHGAPPAAQRGPDPGRARTHRPRNAILSTATLSFLGLGAQPPTPEWGAMLNSGRDYMRYAPW